MSDSPALHESKPLKKPTRVPQERDRRFDRLSEQGARLRGRRRIGGCWWKL